MSDTPSAQGGNPLLDPRAVARQLRRLATLPQPPWLHADIARRMAERLVVIKLQPATLLNWWGFLGDSREPLSQAYPKARQIWVEPTEALRLRSAELVRRSWWAGLTRSAPAIEVQAEQGLAPGAAQMLWANMVLHAAADLPGQLRRWQAALAVDGFVMFSCLGPDSLRELRPLYQALGWGAPLQDWVDMHDIGDMMVEAGFADPVMDQERIKLTWATPEALLNDLRLLGGNAAPQRFEGLRTPRWRARLEQALLPLAGPDGRLSLSLEVIYGHAFKAAPRLRMAQEVSLSADSLRTMAKQGAKRTG